MNQICQSKCWLANNKQENVVRIRLAFIPYLIHQASIYIRNVRWSTLFPEPFENMQSCWFAFIPYKIHQSAIDIRNVRWSALFPQPFENMQSCRFEVIESYYMKRMDVAPLELSDYIHPHYIHPHTHIPPHYIEHECLHEIKMNRNTTMIHMRRMRAEAKCFKVDITWTKPVSILTSRSRTNNARP